MSRTGRQARARTGNLAGRRSQRLARNAAATKRCWFSSSSEPARTEISLTDPDSRAMAAHTKVAVGYNIPGGGRREEQADRRRRR